MVSLPTFLSQIALKFVLSENDSKRSSAKPKILKLLKMKHLIHSNDANQCNLPNFSVSTITDSTVRFSSELLLFTLFGSPIPTSLFFLSPADIVKS
jgi:hypothetical protein